MTLSLAAAPLLLCQMATAQSETVLYSFQNNGKEGIFPRATLVLDGAGDLFGTTSASSFSGGTTHGYGALFKISPGGTPTVLHTFQDDGTDGIRPNGALMRDKAGNLYGATGSGGTYGYGTIFKHSPNGTWTILHSFQGAPTDGAAPVGALIMDSVGNLYGATQYGGQHYDGTIFKLAPDGTLKILHSFGYSGAKAVNPYGGLLRDSAGNLYGTTYQGGTYNRGTAFKFAPTGALTILYSFGATKADASLPQSGLVMDGAGNLYGATENGGADGLGAVYEVALDGSESVLYSFKNNGTDGTYPMGGVILDGAGNLYGTTDGGGPNGYGVLYKIAPDGTETILHAFGSNSNDGLQPLAGLAIDAAGNLYGTTANGGGTNGYGTVFKVVP